MRERKRRESGEVGKVKKCKAVYHFCIGRRIYSHLIGHLLGNPAKKNCHYFDDSLQTSQAHSITFKVAHLRNIMSVPLYLTIIASVLFNDPSCHITFHHIRHRATKSPASRTPPGTNETHTARGKFEKKITAAIPEDVHKRGLLSDVPGITGGGLPATKTESSAIHSPSACRNRPLEINVITTLCSPL